MRCSVKRGGAFFVYYSFAWLIPFQRDDESEETLFPTTKVLLSDDICKLFLLINVK